MQKNNLVVVTRDAAGNKRLASLLTQKGVKVYKLPTIKIKAVKPGRHAIRALKNISAHDFIIFTSPRAVVFFIKAARGLKIPAAKINRPAIVVIGPSTCNAAEKAGLSIALRPKNFSTNGIVKSLGHISGKKIFLPRSAIAPWTLSNKLRQKKAVVTEAPIYTTLPVRKRDLKFIRLLKKRKIGCLTFASSSAVAAFPGRLKNDILLKQALLIPVVCIGPATAKAATKQGFKKIITAKTHNAEGIAHAVP